MRGWTWLNSRCRAGDFSDGPPLDFVPAVNDTASVISIDDLRKENAPGNKSGSGGLPGRPVTARRIRESNKTQPEACDYGTEEYFRFHIGYNGDSYANCRACRKLMALSSQEHAR
jgi:hypothetical protein